jgi:hypothetical protein
MTLDELLYDYTPTYIKMDIEGGELEALKGARNIIKSAMPILAICVYHKQSDFWEIPLLIRSITEGYRFFLRAYSWSGFEVVCYAVPEKRIREEYLAKTG